MRRFGLVPVGVLALAAFVTAQQQPGAPGTVADASALKTFAVVGGRGRPRRQGEGRAEARSGRFSSQPLLQLSPYNVNLEYRVGVANAALHENEAELFYVIDGAGTMVTGRHAHGVDAGRTRRT